MKRTTIALLLLFFTGVFVLVSSCRKDKGIPDTFFSDAKFFALIKDTSSVHYYKDASLNSQFTSDAAHGSRQYKLRMNNKAFAACTASGKLPTGGTFPDSSLLVKELKNPSSGAVEEYAAIYKLNGTWNWAKFKADNTFNTNSTTIFSIGGDANTNCISCHNFQARDYVRTFDSHP